jgi:hypothetical protein
MRQSISPGRADALLPTIPLMPAMRLFVSDNNAAASPISRPPTIAETVVNWPSLRSPELSFYAAGSGHFVSRIKVQIARHNGRVSIRMMSPVSPVVAVAQGAPIASASQPKATNPTGPVPMHTDRTPSMRLRISGGEDK